MTASRVLVQKFGGTSVSTAARRSQVVEHVRAAQADGYQVAVVVSAMGRRGEPYATDTLLDLLRADGGVVDGRDYDLIFGCGEAISVAMMSQTLRRSGIAAHGLTAAQARIYTDGRHQQAEITHIDPARVLEILAGGEVPVLAGAQGVIPGTLDVTTLGRGGSDTSGVALGVALGAEKVEIYTDVPGIATADPRLIPEATFLPGVSYAAAHELASFGAAVVHPRAVATGWRGGIPIVVRSTFDNEPGTTIDDGEPDPPIVGLAAFPALESVALPADAIDPAIRAQLARDGLPSIVDDRTGDVVVGAPAERRLDVRAALGPAEKSLMPRGTLGWLSVVGEEAELRQRFTGVEEVVRPLFLEWAPRRLTVLIPTDDRVPVATVLYRLAFQPAGAHRPARSRVGLPVT